MLSILGALFVVGTALSFFVSSMICSKTDLFISPRDGALWAVIPAFVYVITESKFVMVLSTWIPTLLMVVGTKHTVCKV
jgi:hypothetical protein